MSLESLQMASFISAKYRISATHDTLHFNPTNLLLGS